MEVRTANQLLIRAFRRRADRSRRAFHLAAAAADGTEGVFTAVVRSHREARPCETKRRKCSAENRQMSAPISDPIRALFAQLEKDNVHENEMNTSRHKRHTGPGGERTGLYPVLRRGGCAGLGAPDLRLRCDVDDALRNHFLAAVLGLPAARECSAARYRRKEKE